MFWTHRHRTLAPAIIGLATTLFVAAAYWFGWVRSHTDLLAWPENKSRDMRVQHGRKATPDPRLVYLAIDDLTYSLSAASPEEIAQSPALQLMSRGWPFRRSVYPLVMQKLYSAGAKLVVFDLLFYQQSPDDASFRQALDQYRDKVILGWNLVLDGGVQGDFQTLQMPAPSLVPQTEPLDERLGFVNYPTDPDGIIRRAQFSTRLSSYPEIYPSLANRITRKVTGPNAIPDGTSSHFFRWTGWPNSPEHPDSGFASSPLWEIFVTKLWERNYRNGEFFRDKVVFIGPKGNFIKDELNTPFGIMPGPELHLNVVNALLQNELIGETSAAADLLMIILAGVLACGAVYRIQSPGGAILGFLLLLAAYLGLAQLLYDRASLFIPVFYPAACFSLCGLFGFTSQFVTEQIERRRTRAMLERYVSKNLVRELLDNPKTFLSTLGGTRLPVSALFSDVRDFTTLAERSDPAQLVAQLNEYLQEMTRIVFRHDGTLDKFVGDAVMAVWGNIKTVDVAQDAGKAVRAALAMLESLRGLNERWTGRGWLPWAIGIGINQGEAIAGNIGSNEKMDLTVIGDAVNTASRLESLTKQYGIPLLIGPLVADHIRKDFHLQRVDRAAAKGKKLGLEIYTVLGEKSHPLPEPTQHYLHAYESGIDLFRRREFTAAREAFDRALQTKPEDSLARLYQRRCRQYENTPPPENWDGTTVFTEK